MGFYIGMDVGGTYARLKVADERGHTLCEKDGRGGTIRSSGYEQMRSRFRTLVLPNLEQLGLEVEDCAGLCLSASGIDSEQLKQQYMTILADMGFPRECLSAYNDCEMLLALRPEPCIAIIAGTGSVAMGRGWAEGPVSRCGGWSYIISDEGSAPYISLEAMRVVLKHWDSQLEAPVLAQLFAQEGFASPEEMAAYCHENLAEKDRLAHFAPLVEKAALRGEAQAMKILDMAASGLFRLVKTVMEKMDAAERPVSVLLWGSVLVQNQMVQQALRKKMNAAYPLAEIITLHKSAVDCALRLAMGMDVRYEAARTEVG